MDLYQIVWLFILIPIFLILGCVFLYNGWDTIANGKFHVSPVEWFQIWSTQISEGEKEAKKYRKKILSDKPKMISNGYRSMLGGVVYLIVGVYFALLLFNAIKN